MADCFGGEPARRHAARDGTAAAARADAGGAQGGQGAQAVQFVSVCVRAVGDGGPRAERQVPRDVGRSIAVGANASTAGADEEGHTPNATAQQVARQVH